MSTPNTGNDARLARIRALLASKELPALQLTKNINIQWLSGFTGSHAYILLTQDRAVFATDSRYAVQSKEQCPGFEIVLLELIVVLRVLFA